jgi:hypothetical protein
MSQPFFLNPNAGFNPSSSQQMSFQRQPVRPTSNPEGIPRPSPFGGATPQRLDGGSQPTMPPQQPWSGSGTAVRPTNQGGPQASWMQNMASFAGGGVEGSPAFGNQPTGPVRRLVDVLGPQPFGEQNPMTLLMKALQGSGYGLGLPTNNADTYAKQWYTSGPANKYKGQLTDAPFNPSQQWWGA